jgi:hypothetical protein
MNAARRGGSSPGTVRQGPAGLARRGLDGPGTVSRGEAGVVGLGGEGRSRQGSEWQDWRGGMRPGMFPWGLSRSGAVCSVAAGVVWPAASGLVLSYRGEASRGSPGRAGLVPFRRGPARQAGRVPARHVGSRRGVFWLGAAGRARRGTSWRGLSRLGSAGGVGWGSARLGIAGSGLAWQVRND